LLSRVKLDARAGDEAVLTVDAPKLRLSPHDADAEPAQVTLRVNDAGGHLNVKLALSALRGEGARVAVERVALEVEGKRADASYALELAGPLALDLKGASGEAPEFSGVIRITDPTVTPQPLAGNVTGRVSAAWGDVISAAAALTVSIDGAKLAGRLNVEDLARERFNFDFEADRLDVDRYLPPRVASTSTDAKGTGGSALPAAGGEARRRRLLDVERVARLDFSGSIRVGNLLARGLRAESVNLSVRGRNGRLDVPSASAALYGGTTAGNASLDLSTRSWRLVQRVDGVQLAPILRAASGAGRIEGRTSAALDFEGRGETGAAILRSLSGNVRVAVSDGAIRGIDLAELLRQANVALGSKSSIEGTARSADRTAFSELSASFVLKEGVATSRDLAFRSEAVKATGSGRVDLASGAIDYRLATTLVGVSADIRNRVIARIGEVAIPVRVTGTLEAPKYSVDLGSLAATAAANEAARRLQGGGEGRKDPIGDILRGLLRRQ
jgi:AsmA protein